MSLSRSLSILFFEAVTAAPLTEIRLES